MGSDVPDNLSHGVSDDGLSSGSRCHLEWGRDGVRLAVGRGDVLVIVDTLRFSTAIAAAVGRGIAVRPHADADEMPQTRQAGQGRDDMAASLFAGLSPHAYAAMPQGSRVDVVSPNGATCCRLGGPAPALFVAALVNAAAVAGAVRLLAIQRSLSVSVIACGERRDPPTEDGSLRYAVEDYLGAGAIISALGLPASPDARVCRAAFEGVRESLVAILWDSESGQELREKGLGEDVVYAARLDASNSVPVLRGEWLVSYET